MNLILRYWWLIAIVLIYLKSRKSTIKKTIVNVGDTGDNVQRLQSWVVNKGYAIQIDGIFGESTSIAALAAILEFKADYQNAINKYFKVGTTSYGVNTGLHSVDLDWLFNNDVN